MSKNEKRSPKKHKPCEHEKDFLPLKLPNIPESSQQFDSEGFGKAK